LLVLGLLLIAVVAAVMSRMEVLRVEIWLRVLVRLLVHLYRRRMRGQDCGRLHRRRGGWLILHIRVWLCTRIDMFDRLRQRLVGVLAMVHVRWRCRWTKRWIWARSILFGVTVFLGVRLRGVLWVLQRFRFRFNFRDAGTACTPIRGW